MNGTIPKTLVIRFSSIGDVVLSSPLLRLLRRRFPGARIDYLVKADYADLLRHSPHCSSILEFPAGGGLTSLIAMRRRVAAEGYDLIIDLHDSLRSRVICAGRRRVVRIRKRKLARSVLIAFKWDIYDRCGGSPSVAERYLETVAPWGVENDGAGLELAIPAEAVEKARRIADESGIGETGPLLGVCPSARHLTKIWPAERFGEAAADLAARRRVPVVLFGSEAERGRCDEVARVIGRIQPEAPVVNLAGRLTLLETGAMMDRCLLVLTNDSGLMHVAAARKRPVIAIFGSTVRQFGFFPYGTSALVVEHETLSCRPCTHVGRERCPLGHFRCMLDIPAGRVLEASHVLLKD